MDIRTTVTLSVALHLLVAHFGIAQTISGATNTCEGNTNSYSFSGPSGSGFAWTVTGGSIVGSPNQSSVQVLWNNPGIRKVEVVVNTFNSSPPSPLCGFCPRYDLDVNVSLPTIAGTLASSSSTVCSNTSVALNISGNRGLPTAWRVRSRIGTEAWASWSTFSSSSATSRSYTVSNSSVSQKTYEFQTIVANGNCIPHYTNTKSIYVDAPTQTGTLSYSGGSTICSGSSVNLNLSGKLGTIQSWQVRTRIGSGSWSSWSIFSASVSTFRSYTVSNSNSSQKSYEFRVLVDNGTCASQYSNTSTLSVNSPSIGGTAIGTKDYFGIGTGLVSLQNNRGHVIKWQHKPGTGNWTDLNGQTGTTLHYTNVNQTTKYRAIVQNGNCISQNSSEAQITIHNVPSLLLNGSENIAPGESAQLITDGGFFSYEWKKDNVVLVGETGNSITVKKPGAYNVTIEGTNGGATYTTGEYVIGSVITDQPYNYITTIDHLVGGIDTTTSIFDSQVSDYLITTSYFDGLGRRMQTNILGNSPSGHDLITEVVYDEFGRQDKEYLPYAALERLGSFDVNASTNQFNFYNTQPLVAHTDSAYFRKVYESSSLNRLLEQGAPGEAWQPGTGNTTMYFYQTNTLADEVLFWGIDFITDGLKALDYFSSAQLTKNVTTDEEGHAVVEFVDKLGQTILKRVQAVESPSMTTYTSGEWADTYYCYDDFGNLRYVLPPEAVKEIMQAAGTNFPHAPSSTLLARWAFQYKYDGRRRMTEKKVPGAEPVKMIYDDRDRLVLTQDGEQRKHDKWLFTKYDQLNRPIMTGEKQITTPEATLRDLLDGPDWHQNYAAYETLNGDKFGYTSNSLPKNITTDEIYTVTYYDDYTFPHASSYSFETELGNTAPFDRVKGQVTGTKTKVLDGGNTWLDGVTYYDDRYRPIQTISENQQGGTDRVTHKYDFIGKVLETQTTHNDGTETTQIKRRYEYDHAGRLLRTYHQVNALDEVLLSENFYNELGELIEKNLHSEDQGSSFAQSVDYRYNIRGWLTSINDSDLSDGEDDYFGMELGYNQELSGLNVDEQYNGNISAMKWQSFGEGEIQAYTYQYDPMNRLVTADHSTIGQPNTNAYDVAIGTTTNPGYDLNGNLTQLTRTGKSGFIDQLTYTYGDHGNQLQYVEDPTATQEGFINGHTGTTANPDYAYDANGNMTKDLNKGITTITYNHLNLPTRVEKDANNYILYTYDATGIKLRQEVYEGGALTKTTDYIGEFIYENDEIALIQHEEGRIVPDPATGNYDYEYYLKDHLGNNRVVFTTNPKTHVFTATMESEEAASEEALFSNLPETRVTFTTASQSPDEVAELDNVNPIGPAISLSVGAGDTIRMEGYAYFEGGSGYSSTTSLGSFIASVAGAFGGLNGGTPEQQVTFDAFDNAYGILGMNGSADDNVPAAYLNYIFFDENMVYKQSGFKQISGAADFSKEYVEFPTDIVAPETGFIYCFVSMESATGRVFWDDFKVTVNEHPVVQRSDYYPFGSIAQQYNRITTPKNRYLYNDGTERVDVLDLGIDMTPFRSYDPLLGRWWQIDPLEKHHESPYAWVTNNPILWNDPLGLDTLNTTDPDFDPSKINDDDVVIGPNVLDEVVVTAESSEESDDDNSQSSIYYPVGQKVMGHRDGVPGLEDFFGHRTFGPYDVNAEGKIIGVTPATGEPPVGSGPVKILSVVKRTQSLLRLAQQTGKSPVIRKEINKLLRELIRGNFNAGKGSKSLGFGGVHEMRGANGARVYYKNTSEGIKIVGYSNKANQSKVIGELKKLYD